MRNGPKQKKGTRRNTMAKQEKEVEKWVTMNGVRVPIFKDGSVGGPKAIRDKIKNMNSFDKAKKGLTTDTSNAKERVDMLKAELKKHPNDMHTNEIKNRLKKAEDDYKKLKKSDTSNDNFKTKKEWDDKEKQIAKNKAEADDRNGKKEPTEEEMKAYLKERGQERFVKELNPNQTEEGYQKALRYVYDQNTLSKEEFKKKYFTEKSDKKGTKASERTANQAREEELKSKIKQLEKNAFNKDARAVLNELRARADEHRRFESDREDMQARLKSLKAKEKELTKTSAFKPEARQTLKELRARIEEIQLMERNDAHELTSYKRKK